VQASKTTVIECERKLAEAKNYADVKAAQENEKKGKQRSVSDPMKRLIVETRLKHQHKFDDTVNKNANVWEIVHADIKATLLRSADNALLNIADIPDVDYMKALFSREQGKFRFHCWKINAATQSGASADDVDLVTEYKTSCTDLFFAAAAESRPMSVPPLVISGGSAARGGVASAFPSQTKKRKAAAPLSDDDVEEFNDQEESQGSQSSSSSCTVEDMTTAGPRMMMTMPATSQTSDIVSVSASVAGSARERDSLPACMTPEADREMHLHLGGSKPTKTRPIKTAAPKGDDLLMQLMQHLSQQTKEAEMLRAAERAREREHERAIMLLLSPQPSARPPSPQDCD
jgi:hypothetical protein